MWKDQLWVGIAIIALLNFYIIHLFLTTHYIVGDNKLLIKSGIFYRKEIPIECIRKVSETNDLTSAPAPSFDRLEILYNKFDTVMVSPKEKQAFMELLKEIKPEIEIRYKK